MKLRDKLYLRFGLYHRTIMARIVAAFLEGLLWGIALLVVFILIVMAAKFSWYLYVSYTTAQQDVVVERQKTVHYERIVVACLNRQWFVANGELFTCEAK